VPTRHEAFPEGRRCFTQSALSNAAHAARPCPAIVAAQSEFNVQLKKSRGRHIYGVLDASSTALSTADTSPA
jgi:hypothetical protein